uniref:RING-type domain-containing protein n=1 Tax=Arcella intermedia TaxID=1963864 RepID=A0A6B2LBQ0_9EUKA
MKDFECPLCCEVLLDPTTILCGHTYCSDCIQRVFDCTTTGQAQCPICRRYIFHTGRPAINVVLNDIIKKYLPKLYTSRCNERLTLTENLMNVIPLFFVGVILFPKEMTRLHVYEPQYRLMIRRCLFSNGKFGMVLPGFIVGTEVQIKECTPLTDGRFLLVVVGLRRFKIRETQNVDGYEVAQYEELQEITEPNLEGLMKDIEINMHSDIGMARQTYFDGLQRNSAYDFSISTAALLPISTRQKHRLLEITSTKLRLETSLEHIKNYNATRRKLSYLMLFCCILSLLVAHFLSFDG